MESQLPQVELLSQTHQSTVSTFPFSEAVDTGTFINSTMTFFGTQVNTIDFALIVLCPIFAALGVMAASILSVRGDAADTGIVKRFFSGLFSNIGNLFIGIVVGIVVSLFFIGAINNDISSLARVLVLTVFLGYKAPVLWQIKNSAQVNNGSQVKPSAAVPAKNKMVSLERTAQDGQKQDVLRQERLKRERLKLAAKNG